MIFYEENLNYNIKNANYLKLLENIFYDHEAGQIVMSKADPVTKEFIFRTDLKTRM